jgi:hypothetical protein
LTEEVRQRAGELLDLLEPLVRRIREQPADQGSTEASCANCPVCAVITVLRGGRSELALRLADQAAEMLAVLRTALEEGVGAPSHTRAAGPPATSSGSSAASPGESAVASESPLPRVPRVQRITVVRDSHSPSSRPC